MQKYFIKLHADSETFCANATNDSWWNEVLSVWNENGGDEKMWDPTQTSHHLWGSVHWSANDGSHPEDVLFPSH